MCGNLISGKQIDASVSQDVPAQLCIDVLLPTILKGFSGLTYLCLLKKKENSINFYFLQFSID
jgi:hypothetical protein